jgi:succinate-acetate transporter protein
MDGQRDGQALATVWLRPIGSPLPLGMLALAVATFTVAGLQLSWIPVAQQHDVGLAVLTFAVPLQGLSCIYGFLARDSAAGTGMALQAGGWFAIGTAIWTGKPGHVSPALGLALFGAGTVLMVVALTASLTKVLAGLVMALTAIRFYLTGVYEFTSAPSWEHAAGIAGLVLAAVALYAGLAFELEDSHRATMLPTFRRGAAHRALAGNPADEVRGVHHEAGVRSKL